jgi:hypothetical protein
VTSAGTDMTLSNHTLAMVNLTACGEMRTNA